jgi:hypothetical protein
MYAITDIFAPNLRRKITVFPKRNIYLTVIVYISRLIDDKINGYRTDLARHESALEDAGF